MNSAPDWNLALRRLDNYNDLALIAQPGSEVNIVISCRVLGFNNYSKNKKGGKKVKVKHVGVEVSCVAFMGGQAAEI